MKIKTIDLYDAFNIERNYADKGFLTALLHENSQIINPKRKYPAILIIPGGAFSGVCDRESEPIAIKFFEMGFQVFMLDYTVKKTHIEALQEALLSIKYVKENAEDFRVLKNKVAVVGFSAGGHIAGNISVHGRNLQELFKDSSMLVNTQPDVGIISYPVVFMSGECAHELSAFNLCGDSEDIRKLMSFANYVNEKSSPIFLWHTLEDELVPVENSLYLLNKYKENDIPFSFHIFEKGRHGQAIKDILAWEKGMIDTLSLECSHWIDLCKSWLKERNFEISD